MNPKIKSFINNPWIIGIGCALLPLIPIAVYWKAVIDFLKRNIEVPIWVLILLPIVSILLLLLILVMIAGHNESKNNTIAPKYFDYKEDYFDGMYYRWNYIATSPNTYSINNITPYCFNCKCFLIDNLCPKCGTNYNYIKLSNGFQIRKHKSQQELTAIILSEVERRYPNTNMI
jgi:hypothetical protein